MVDFNINLRNCYFVNNMHSNSLVPYITVPKPITPRSKTMISNIFFNGINKAAISGNLITDISDYHAQFFIVCKTL